MEIQVIKPRKGSGTYRRGDSDDLVVMEDLGPLPPGSVCLQTHGIIIFCTEGRAQFDYDGTLIKLQKDDIFLFLTHTIASNFLTSSDFNCRQIWFTNSEMGNIDMYNFSRLKLYPVLHLNDDEVQLFDTYFRLLYDRMKLSTSALAPQIVRSLFDTLLLELLAIMRRSSGVLLEQDLREAPNSSLHKKRIVDHFMKLVEMSDGRIRRVAEFASQMNMTPKYLSAVLKEVMNIKPSVFIQHYTMKAIQRRLRFSDMTMQEIANDLNFPNPSFFGKYCKDHLRMTPLEYRNKYSKMK